MIIAPLTISYNSLEKLQQKRTSVPKEVYNTLQRFSIEVYKVSDIVGVYTLYTGLQTLGQELIFT